ncbi:MAG: hypothetical protein KGO50_10770 [Myxococcales bacterium]|jgi:uncharacterized membrane protein YqiK|nr:hypothetical protein [Myxococcales bacterium]
MEGFFAFFQSGSTRNALFGIMMLVSLFSLTRRYFRQRSERAPVTRVDDAGIRAMVARGDRYRAMKIYRDMHRVDPTEARRVIETMEAELAAQAQPPPP